MQIGAASGIALSLFWLGRSRYQDRDEKCHYIVGNDYQGTQYYAAQ